MSARWSAVPTKGEDPCQKATEQAPRGKARERVAVWAHVAQAERAADAVAAEAAAKAAEGAIASPTANRAKCTKRARSHREQ